MVGSITDRYVTATGLDDTLGEGLRLHTDQDELYELRSTAGTDIRVHGNADDWTATVRFPDTDLDPAYERFDTIAEDLEAAYGEELITPATRFLRAARDTGEVITRSGPITLKYNETGENSLLTLDELESDDVTGKEVAGTLVSYAGSGAASGGATGLMLGNSELAVLGTVAGAVGGFASAFYTEHEKRFPHSPAGYGIKGLRNMKTRVRKRRERKEKAEERLNEQDIWDTLNEKNRLAVVADTTRDLDEARRYEEVKETDVEETVETLMDCHFHGFPDRAGVTAMIKAESYDAALDFAATILDRTTPDIDRPSIYHTRRIFRDVFEAAHEDRQEDLVATVLEDGAAQEVRDYLDDTHPGLVQDVGGTRQLYAEGDTG